ncbi:hypothetical protein Tsubulata_023370, partial [Turnera subulata]
KVQQHSLSRLPLYRLLASWWSGKERTQHNIERELRTRLLHKAKPPTSSKTTRHRLSPSSPAATENEVDDYPIVLNMRNLLCMITEGCERKGENCNGRDADVDEWGNGFDTNVFLGQSASSFPRHVQTTVAYGGIVKGSYIPTTISTTSIQTKPPPSPQNNNNYNTSQEKKTAALAPAPAQGGVVGAFQKLPLVMPSLDILNSALKKAKRVPPTKGIANIAKRERNRGAKQLDALMKELAVPLRYYLENFPPRRHLHPYERSLIDFTLGEGNYEQVLRKVDALRKKVVSVGKQHASLCAKVLRKVDALRKKVVSVGKQHASLCAKGLQKLEEVFQHEGKAVDDLLYIAKTLRAMPVVDLETPTLCLVGAPNVGKSSLVRILSSGKPEVCNYPFTTRGILMGHIAFNFQHFQVTDTPGLLKRQDEDRNNLEKLTLAVLSHLPTAILYVHDLTGECGTSPSDQFGIYKEIKGRFADHIWLDVVSKCDLLQESSILFITEDDNTGEVEMERYKKLGPVGALHVSVKTEEGVNELKARVHEMLVAQMDRIRSMETTEGEGEGEAEVGK